MWSWLHTKRIPEIIILTSWRDETVFSSVKIFTETVAAETSPVRAAVRLGTWVYVRFVRVGGVGFCWGWWHIGLGLGLPFGAMIGDTWVCVEVGAT